MWKRIQFCSGHFKFFRIEPSGVLAEHEGSENPFNSIRGIRELGYGERNLVLDTIIVNSVFTGAFSYTDIANFDIDLIKEIVETARDKMKK